jgi:hypothetical protein
MKSRHELVTDILAALLRAVCEEEDDVLSSVWDSLKINNQVTWIPYKGQFLLDDPDDY